MTEQSKMRRLRRFLRSKRLVFLEVGARVGEDRVIEELKVSHGATVTTKEFSALLREIVRLLA